MYGRNSSMVAQFCSTMGISGEADFQFLAFEKKSDIILSSVTQ
jgi:hypothetical protein